MHIRTLDEMFDLLRSWKSKRLVVACANDLHTLEAAYEAVKRKLIVGILIGDRKVILKNCRDMEIDPAHFRIFHQPDEDMATAEAVSLINIGKGDLIMKGLISTDKYMRVILDKERGLMDPGAILCHISLVQLKNYHKLLVVGDVAIIPLPELKEKIAIAESLIRIAHAIGIEKPKLAVLAATEQILPKMPACVDGALLSKMAERGQIKGAIIDGPLSLDVILDKSSAELKKITSPVAGDADCILFPNIETGNTFYKFHTKLTGGELGAIVTGARVPAILSSRGDSVMTKLYSIALGALLAHKYYTTPRTGRLL